MTPELLTMLASRRLLANVYGYNATVTRRDIEADGRKQKKAVADLVSQGYIVHKESDDYYIVTDLVLKLVQSEAADLIAVWDAKHHRHGKWDERENWPFVRVGEYSLRELTVGQLKNVLDLSSEHHWYVVDSWPLDHSNPYNPKDTDGPYMLEEAQAKLKERRAGKDRYLEITVSNPALLHHVRCKEFEGRFNEFWPKCLPWGLSHFGILTKEESKLVHSGDDLAHGLLLLSHSIAGGNDPEQWEQAMEKGFEKCIENLGKLHERMRVIYKIKTGIVNYGGWDKFRADCREELRKALLKQEEADGEEAQTEEAESEQPAATV